MGIKRNSYVNTKLFNKKTIYFLSIFVCIFVVEIFLIQYDDNFGNVDGIIKGVYFKNVFVLIYGTLALAYIVSEIKKLSKIFQNLLLSCLSIFLSLFVFEIISYLIFFVKIVEFKKPEHNYIFNVSYRLPDIIWQDIEQLGFWRRPNMCKESVDCEGNIILSTSNSIGARDKERSLLSSQKRIVIIGDSFVEGVLVDQNKRWTDLLEQKSKLEHLNFGIMGSRPIDYWLRYKNMIKSFSHQVVIIGVLPANDFENFNESTDGKSLYYRPIYIPYYVNEYPNLKVKFTLESASKSIFSDEIHKDPEKIKKIQDSIFRKLDIFHKLDIFLAENSYMYNLILKISSKLFVKNKMPSMFEEYSQTNWHYLKFSLEQIIQEAEKKRIIVVAIPTLNDLEATNQLHRETRLSDELGKFCQLKKIGYVDLLVEFHKRNEKEWSKYYLPCDGHFNIEGHKLASEIIANNAYYKAALIDNY